MIPSLSYFLFPVCTESSNFPNWATKNDHEKATFFSFLVLHILAFRGYKVSITTYGSMYTASWKAGNQLLNSSAPEWALGSSSIATQPSVFSVMQRIGKPKDRVSSVTSLAQGGSVGPTIYYAGADSNKLCSLWALTEALQTGKRNPRQNLCQSE